MEDYNLKAIITDLPIYGAITVSLLTNNGDLSVEGRKLLINLFHVGKIDLKCTHCGKEYPFSVSHTISKQLFGKKNYELHIFGELGSDIDDPKIIDYGAKFPKQDEGIIEYTLICSMDSTHYYKLFLHYVLAGNTMFIEKIGQMPPNRELKNVYSNEYKNILKKYDSFDDYRKYEQSTERNLLAGSCTYLRRILEKFVNKMLENVDDGAKKDCKQFCHKLKLVTPQFDQEIQDILQDSYTLLSKGVHELDNNEITDFYNLMAEVINVQLESEKEKTERELKMSLLRKNIKTEINNKNKK